MKILLSILLVLCLGCTSAFSQTFIEEMNGSTFSPPEPLTVYSFKETPWTGWNKFWFASAIGGQLADTLSTQDALGRGCVETNPLFGENPSIGLMVLAKVAVLGGGGYLIEAVDFTVEERKDARNIFYGIMSVVGTGAAIHNYSIDCGE